MLCNCKGQNKLKLVLKQGSPLVQQLKNNLIQCCTLRRKIIFRPIKHLVQKKNPHLSPAVSALTRHIIKCVWCLDESLIVKKSKHRRLCASFNLQHYSRWSRSDSSQHINVQVQLSADSAPHSTLDDDDTGKNLSSLQVGPDVMTNTAHDYETRLSGWENLCCDECSAVIIPVICLECIV